MTNTGPVSAELRPALPVMVAETEEANSGKTLSFSTCHWPAGERLCWFISSPAKLTVANSSDGSNGFKCRATSYQRQMELADLVHKY